ncbi:hypothetical protein ACT4S5_03960 [Kocuria oceani]|uniref:hypothetical protein n=1 Tax=Kocuria oceani TaxID=988827 RepID=UPI004035BFC2
MTALPAPAGPTIAETPADIVPVPAAPPADSPAGSPAEATPVDETWLGDPALIRPGDRIEVWEQGTLCHVGTVGQSAPHLGLLWILEAGTGARRLVPVHGYRLRRSPLARAA